MYMFDIFEKPILIQIWIYMIWPMSLCDVLLCVKHDYVHGHKYM